MLGNRRNPVLVSGHGHRLSVAAALFVLGAAALAAMAVAAPSVSTEAETAVAADESSSRCTTRDDAPLTLFHGSRLRFVIVAKVGAPAVKATALAAGQSEQTVDYRLTKLAAAEWSFQSLRVDRPTRTVLHRVEIQVSFAVGSQEVVRCDVYVIHRSSGVVAAGANCVPKTLRILHGQAGVFRIVPIPGSAPILSTGLTNSQPAATPNYRIQRLAGNRFSFRSRKVDPPARVETYVVRIRVKYGPANAIVASLVTKCIAVVTHIAPATNFVVQLGTTYDHAVPRSDVCVDVATAPAQPGAQAGVRLLGPAEQQASQPQEQTISLDSRGAGRARFLVNAIGTYQIAVMVTSASGRTATAGLTINNANPSGNCS